MSIYKKLHEIQKNIKGLGKDSKSFGYQYTSGSKILSHIRPLMDKKGLLLKQEIISIENQRMDYLTKNGNKSEVLTKAMMRFTWIDVETGEKDENEFGANGQNDWEKGLGSALTYAERYFLLKYFHIATDEDDVDNEERKTTDPPEPQSPAEPKEKPKLTEKGFKFLTEEGTKDQIKTALRDRKVTEEQKIKLNQALEIAK